jgi:hypothetical protein
LEYQSSVNVQKFTSSFTFVPNGQNVAFVLNNATNNPPNDGPGFSSGAGCEGGFYQAFDPVHGSPNNVFALEFDSWSFLGSVQSFSYSSVQIYQQNQSPCNPNDSGPDYTLTDKISTSPVALDSPAGTQGTTTGHTYSATVTYDGSNLTLNMYDVTAGGACPGANCFTHTWSVDIPSWVDGNTAYVGFTAASGEISIAPLYIGSFSYTVGSTSTSQTAAPTFSPAAGTYTTAQSVTLSDATAGATIYYTTNGSTPTTSSTKYTSPITISGLETVEAMAVATGDTNSAVESAAYNITPEATVATPTFSPAAGTYSSAQSVIISDATSGATIYYTTNGTTPTASSTRYTGSITVSSTETLEAIAVAPGDTNSGGASAAYNINSPAVSTPTFSPAAGTYTSAQSVTLSDATSGATIYYTTNGNAPTTSSTKYTGPITVSSTETLQAIAVAAGDSSGVASAAYTINSSLPAVATPTFSPAAGAFTSAQSVTISDATSGANIYYTTDGSTPTTSSNAYTGAITVSSTETLEAIAIATGDSNSAVASAAYTIASSLPSVATPTFSPAAGTYPSGQSVTLSDATSGATVYYTTNGSTPTTSSTVYTGPITVSSTETLQAIAVASGESAVGSAVYTITAQPNFVLAASAPSLTFNSGGQGTITLTVTPENGFNSPVILACSALPSWATCSFDQATLTPSGGAVSTQLTISATTQSSALRPGSRPFFPFTALAMTVCLLGWRKRRGWHNWVLLAVAYAGLGLVFGCGGTSGGGGTSSTSTPTSSMVTITAISGPLQGTAAVALTVN